MGLTPEEKKAKKEVQRLAKIAAEVEERKRLKRLELEREMSTQAKKKDEVERTYRELMVKIKEPVFRQDIIVMWHTFERAYDKKDQQIVNIVELMNVADDQFQRCLASFCDTIDTMINKFLSDLDKLSQQNDQAMKNLLKSHEQATEVLMEDHKSAETHLRLLLFTSHEEADKSAWAERGENLVKEDESRIKYSNERDDLRSYLESDYNNLWDAYKAVLKQYVAQTSDIQKNVRKLRRKENLIADVIASQGKRLANSGGLLKHLRTELAAYESGTKQAVFRDRRNRYRAACYKQKQRMMNGIHLDTAQLAVLVKATDDTLDWLKAAHKKGERILRMAALCRKFETQREKVLPYGTDQPHGSIKRSLNKQQSDNSMVANAISSTCGLTRMWQRVAQAELSKRALLREKELLLHDNEMLEKRLNDLKSKPFQAKSKYCLCNRKQPVKNIEHPNAVEGALEASKIDKFYSQYK